MRTRAKGIAVSPALLLLCFFLVLAGCRGSTPPADQEPTPTPTELPRLPNPDAYLERGIKLLDARDWRNAAADFTAAINLQPDNVQAYVNRAVAYIHLGMETEAQEDVERAVVLGADRRLVDLAISVARRQR